MYLARTVPVKLKNLSHSMEHINYAVFYKTSFHFE